MFVQTRRRLCRLASLVVHTSLSPLRALPVAVNATELTLIRAYILNIQYTLCPDATTLICVFYHPRVIGLL